MQSKQRLKSGLPSKKWYIYGGLQRIPMRELRSVLYPLIRILDDAYRFDSITTIGERSNGEQRVNVRNEGKRVLEIHGYKPVYTA